MKSKIHKSNFIGVALAISLVVVGPLLFQKNVWGDAMLSSLTKLLSPGELTRSHAREEKLKDCYACHTLTQGIDDSLCLDCHKAVKERLSERDGYHGKLQGNCKDCHTDHKGSDMDIIGLNSNAFNHRLANYALTGKHAEIECVKCHGRQEQGEAAGTRYIGVKFGACTDCHKNPHPNAFGQDCESCHTTTGWSGRALIYTHSRDSKYKLLGKHQEVSCDKCHKDPNPEAKFLLPDTECAQCHQDVHNGQLSKQCQECHNEFAWKGAFVTFNHNEQSSYKLDATHQSVACADCHENKKYKPLKSECVDCHGEYDSIMAGTFGGTAARAKADPHWKRVRCDQCHDTRAGEQRIALYQDKCVECHNPRYGPLLLDWMKDWSKFRLEVQALLQQAAEEVLSENGFERISRKLTETEKIGAHNFLMAPLEWKALRADLEREISGSLARKPGDSETGQARAGSSSN